MPSSSSQLTARPRAVDSLRPSNHHSPNDRKSTYGSLASAHLFGAAVVALLALYKWPLRWALSGAPFLTYVLFLGAAQGYRVLPAIPLSILVLLINFGYSVFSTSWLLYWMFAGACYPAIYLVCLFQFRPVSRFTRRRVRALLRELQMTSDTVAFFELPALEIDVDVEGLLCVRGVSFSFSSLTLVAYGVEVGMKLSDDMEVAIMTDKITVQLFRRVHVSDVYANVKGGEYEMTFGKLAKHTHDDEGDSLMVADTPLLKAAESATKVVRPPMPARMETLTEHMTGGKMMENSSVEEGINSINHMSPDEAIAKVTFDRLVKWIDDTSAITQCRKEAEDVFKDEAKDNEGNEITRDEKDLRAAICSLLHDKATIPHPAKKSIKVSTIKKNSNPKVKRFMHRLPLLLRCLLNPIAYFHPVLIDSITAGGSGRFLQHILKEHVFGTESNIGVKNLKQRISTWLEDANFVVQATDMTGLASVPINTAYDIICHMSFDDMMAYRTLVKEVDLAQIIRLGGADARFTVPSFLLPHHEHLLPPKPDQEEKEELKDNVEHAEGKPKTMQAKKDFDQRVKDQTNVGISAHVRLPACFDQSLLDFIAALVKATKLVEMEKDDPVEKEISNGFRGFAKGLGSDMKNSIQKVAVDAATNDRWIAKLVGKITKQLENAMGDVGYSGDIPVALKKYRDKAEPYSKLLA